MAEPKYNLIYSDGKQMAYQPYVFVNGEWKKALTNIFTNGAWQEIPEVPWTMYDKNTAYVSYSTNNDVIPYAWTTSRCSVRYYSSENALQWANMTGALGGHYVTTYPVYVPATATKLNIYAGDSINYASSGRAHPQFQFGLIPSDATSSNSTANGGVLTSVYRNATGDAYKTFSLTLPEEYKGTYSYHVVVLGKANGSNRADLFVRKIWFT